MGDVDSDRDRETDEWLRLEDLEKPSAPVLGRDGGER